MRVLEVTVGGVFHIRIPDGIAEDDDRWDEWVDAALKAAWLDGRWSDCTEIDSMQVGVLGERSSVLPPSDTSIGDDDPRTGDDRGAACP
jgi:hypothetical protein